MTIRMMNWVRIFEEICREVLLPHLVSYVQILNHQTWSECLLWRCTRGTERASGGVTEQRNVGYFHSADKLDLKEDKWTKIV